MAIYNVKNDDGWSLAYLVGLNTVSSKKNMLCYVERFSETHFGRYTTVDGKHTYDGSDFEPSDFILMQTDLTELDAIRLVALSAPCAASMTMSIPASPLELPFLRVAIYYNPKFPMDARQKELVLPFRPAFFEVKRAKN
jgi:hypothetical protein